MTKEKAIFIQENYLSKIRDYIPDNMVNPIWAEYVAEFKPSNIHAPCTCSPKEWNNIINHLRNRVTETINAEVFVVEDNVVQKKDKLDKLQEESKKRHKK